jgi:plastocyanin
MVNWTPRNILLTSILISALVGSVTGLTTSLLIKTSPIGQTRDLYLFAIDGSFNASATKGLTSDYFYSTPSITVNKGDTLIIHFYNPTDENHTFTLGSPYSNDVTVPHSTTVSGGNVVRIQNATITINANTAGIFPFHCRFHTPQMSGSINVQG